jgi:hypothetical protein
MKLVRESVDDQINQLKEKNYITIDRLDAGDYTMLLVYAKDFNMYEIALTGQEQDFLTPDSQKKKPMAKFPTDFKGSMIKIKSKLDQWINKYDRLAVGSMNKKRTYVYQRLLKNLGFNVTNINGSYEEGFGEYTSFEIYK